MYGKSVCDWTILCNHSGAQTNSDGKKCEEENKHEYAWIQGFYDGKATFVSAPVVNFDLNSN